jgi:hypothetical protein
MNGTKGDGTVTPDEFLEYYANFSANIDSDAYFELMMSNAWNIESRNFGVSRSAPIFSIHTAFGVICGVIAIGIPIFI